MEDEEGCGVVELVIYVSRAQAELSPAAIADIRVRSRVHNKQDDLTGVLLYTDGIFVQALEGPPERLGATLERIARDDRHAGMHIIRQVSVAGRLFPDWAMAFVTEADLPARSPVFRVALEASRGKAEGEQVQMMLADYYALRRPAPIAAKIA